VVIDNATGGVNPFREKRVILRHLFVLGRKNLEVEELRKNDQKHPAEDEADDIAAGLVKNRHLRILALN